MHKHSGQFLKPIDLVFYKISLLSEINKEFMIHVYGSPVPTEI